MRVFFQADPDYRRPTTVILTVIRHIPDNVRAFKRPETSLDSGTAVLVARYHLPEVVDCPSELVPLGQLLEIVIKIYVWLEEVTRLQELIDISSHSGP